MSGDYRGHCFRITAGQAAEYAQAIRLLEGQQAEAYLAGTATTWQRSWPPSKLSVRTMSTYLPTTAKTAGNPRLLLG
jgi:hypothetical protein